MPPNVLLIVLDAARRDALEPYGAPAGSSPAIASLARRGVASPGAYATSSWTLPSHASMFTGLLPRAAGLGQPPAQTPQSVQPVLGGLRNRLLASVLRDAGYSTHGFSANLWASQHAGFDAGFDSFHYFPGGRDERMNALLAGGTRARLAWALEGLRSRSDDGAVAVASALGAAIARADERPSFWFVNLVECHSPYLPPRPWDDLGALERIRAARDSQRYLSFESICLQVAGAQSIPEPSMLRMRHLYARSIAYMDAWLASMLDALQGRGILQDTLVILTSDHGEHFGDGGMIAHGFSLGEGLLRVPLVVAGPGYEALSDDSGGLWSLARLPAAIAAAVGLREHPWSEETLPDGIAVAQYDAIGPFDHPRVLDFARAHGLSAEGVARLTTGYTAACDGTWKLLDADGLRTLYHLPADPLELVPLDPSGAPQELRDALEAALPGGPLASPGGTYDTPGATPATPGGASPEELAALEAQMRLLGYM
ncbi:MAG: sulfatase [Solirubrobacteraceae bacterium]